MSGRAYLSIGDVLTLLREEFPDVTISKIRFLESQGLVNPERSPSGYRKFFEPDVERLRWVLRQQREHFLPLKVIRDRLAAGDLSDLGADSGAEAAAAAGAEAATPTVRRNGKVPQPAHAGVGAVASGARSGGASSEAGTGAGSGTGTGSAVEAGVSGAARTEEQSAQADDDALARILADASRRAARIPDNGQGTERTPLRVVPDLVEPTNGNGKERTEVTATPPRAPVRSVAASPTALPAEPVRPVAPPTAPGAAPVASEPKHAARGAEKFPVSDVPAPSAGSGTKALAEPVAPTVVPAPAPATPAASGRSDKVAPSPAPAAKASALQSMVTGASLTAEELCAASGLSEAELAGLQGFGLIESMMVAGIPTYDEEALTVANLASDFRKFGIEPRHLRLYRNAVDREMGLIEQVIIPLLRQRNPESRQRAVDGAEELGALGQTMRATLLRAALRRHLGG